MDIEIEMEEASDGNAVDIVIHITRDDGNSEDYYPRTRRRLLDIITGKIDGFDMRERLGAIDSLYLIKNKEG